MGERARRCWWWWTGEEPGSGRWSGGGKGHGVPWAEPPAPGRLHHELPRHPKVGRRGRRGHHRGRTTNVYLRVLPAGSALRLWENSRERFHMGMSVTNKRDPTKKRSCSCRIRVLGRTEISDWAARGLGIGQRLPGDRAPKLKVSRRSARQPHPPSHAMAVAARATGSRSCNHLALPSARSRSRTARSPAPAASHRAPMEAYVVDVPHDIVPESTD